VWDERGFNTIIKGEASEFMNCTEDYDCSGDDRLLLNTIVKNVTYNDSGVTVHNKDGSCISAEYAICTFSLGVLQNEAVAFHPAFPAWKERALATFQMGTYTKIFMQFPPDQVFWNTSTQFFLYADPATRGYYPVFQSLDGPGFLEGSGILFVTVVYEQSYTVEAQDPEITKQQVLAVLRKMYGPENVPLPTAFMYPKWSLEPWTYGSYSNWPAGTTLEMHQNLRANLGRLYFAGEATSPEWYGFLQGAYYEGMRAAEAVVGCLNSTQSCEPYARYPVLHGTTTSNEFNATNGFELTSFQTNGFE
jgi:polyamine oxidase